MKKMIGVCDIHGTVRADTSYGADCLCFRCRVCGKRVKFPREVNEDDIDESIKEKEWQR